MTQQVLVRSMLVLFAVQLASVGLGSVAGIEAQDFVPPETEQQAPSTDGRFNFGLYGFSTRFGLDFEAGTQALVSIAIDLGDVLTDRFRLRPSAEIGFGSDVDTYVVNAEVMYRFTSDEEVAVPYVGAGLGIAGQDDCGFAANCPDAWFQFALGFELRVSEQLNWLLEYHAEDALRRHRLFIGLATRRGG